jgi:hypothetical protein
LNGFLGSLLLILVVGFVAYALYTRPIEAPYPKDSKGDTTIVMPGEGGDHRYTRSPEPQRFWNNGPEIPPRGALIPPDSSFRERALSTTTTWGGGGDGGMVINVRTQGFPESYQPMGLLKQNDGKLLPLYGRRVASRSDRFNYYTRTDTYNPVPLPIQYKRKDCQDPVGCQELFDGDTVKIIPTGEDVTATLYRFDGPMYIPNIL